MKHNKTISQNANNPYVRPISFIAGLGTGAFVTACVFWFLIQNNCVEKNGFIEQGRPWQTHYTRQKAKLSSLETERDMLNNKCAQLAQEIAKLEQKKAQQQQKKK